MTLDREPEANGAEPRRGDVILQLMELVGDSEQGKLPGCRGTMDVRGKSKVGGSAMKLLQRLPQDKGEACRFMRVLYT